MRKTSEYEGEIKSRHTFTGVVKMARYMNRTNSMLFAILTENGNIVKFFYDLYRNHEVDVKESIKVGDNLTFTGYIKSQEVSNYSKCKETFVNRVKIHTEDK